jgi:hypothetical protein
VFLVEPDTVDTSSSVNRESVSGLRSRSFCWALVLSGERIPESKLSDSLDSVLAVVAPRQVWAISPATDITVVEADRAEVME